MLDGVAEQKEGKGAVYIKQSRVGSGVSDIKSSGRGRVLRVEWGKQRLRRVQSTERKRGRKQVSRSLARHSSVDGSTINGRARTRPKFQSLCPAWPVAKVRSANAKAIPDQRIKEQAKQKPYLHEGWV